MNSQPPQNFPQNFPPYPQWAPGPAPRPAPAPGLAPKAPREKISFGQTVSLTGRVIADGFVTIAGLGLPSIFTLFVYTITSSLSPFQFSEIFSIFQFVLLMACFVLPLCLHSSIAIYVHGSLKNSPPAFVAALAGGLERITQLLFFYLRFLIVLFLLGSVGAGLVFLSDLTLPAVSIVLVALMGSGLILLFSKISVLFAASAIEKINITQATIRSWRLTKGNLGPAIVSTIIALSALSLIFLGTREILAITSDNIIVYLFIIIASIFLISFISTIISVVYCQLKISDESHNFTLESIVFDELQIPYAK